MIRTLTLDQVLRLHDKLIDVTGGAAGTRDVGTVEAALARPFATYGGEDLYPTLEDKAAALAHSLARDHPFVDGNKRIAIAAAGVFLKLNGRRLTASQDDLEQTTLALAEGRIDVPELARWIRGNTEPAR